jgi:uncharacterized protein (DUF1330 family)
MPARRPQPIAAPPRFAAKYVDEPMPGEEAMPAYAIGEIRVTDPAKFDTYLPPALASIATHGGRVIGASGAVEMLDGGPKPERVVIIEFPDMEAARRWYASAEYQAALPIRLASAEGRAFLIEGAQPAP